MGLAEDRSSLDRLVRENLPAALRFATRLTGNLDAAEDVLGEALLRAARGWNTFRGESQFRTWLFRIVINAWHDHRSARESPAELPAEILDTRATDPIAATVAGELGELVAKLVSQLPPRQREVLVLTTYEGLGPDEIAEVLRTSAGNVRTNLHFARERLRKQLAPYLAEK
jgi:RNA polymerase sigma-70 factor (ECF subfamily)